MAEPGPEIAEPGEPTAPAPAEPALSAPLIASSPAPLPLKRDRILYERIEEALPYLPVYSRSLLKIKAPVRVTLASTRLPVRQIVDLAPGSLIQFPKSCEESLDLEVGQQVIARGEAVKVGEKFGLRITQMVLPGERFLPLAAKP
jgi:flagellar motor switch/type III secretory pathway protein FliN